MVTAVKKVKKKKDLGAKVLIKPQAKTVKKRKHGKYRNLASFMIQMRRKR